MKKLWIVLLLVWSASVVFGQRFVHPGIDQTPADLAYMKSAVLAKQQPWHNAFERLKKETSLDFQSQAYAHVVRGPYGKPDIGGSELSRAASTAYNSALIWYITRDRAYADQAIEILDTWSSKLWDFDNNDAKLIAGYTGYVFCNAAEILRYSDSGWEQESIEQFTSMLLNVYYPLLRHYYPQANGNWDAAIVHSIMAIAVFTDNRTMFQSGVDHFLYGPINGSVFRYIYPSGQSQESTRDQAHVQFGQSELAGAARIAYSQGIDLFSVGNNRIALGYEYTAKFILQADTPQAYGVISQQRKDVRYDYEYVYQHYTSKGVSMPYSSIAAQQTLSVSPRSVLTARRALHKDLSPEQKVLQVSTYGYPAGASNVAGEPPVGSIFVKPGESLQEALLQAAGTPVWVVAMAGIHLLPASLKIPSEVTLAGQGLRTILFLDPAIKDRDAITNDDLELKNVTIRDLVIESSLITGTPANSRRSFNNIGRRAGIVLVTDEKGKIDNITLLNITVRNSVYSGVTIKGASAVQVINCDFSENGANMVPGVHLLHNLHLSHCSAVEVRGCRLDTSPQGSGLAISHSDQVAVTDCEIARNGYYGVLITESNNISLRSSLIEANNRSGVMAEFLFRGSQNISIKNNQIQYNNGNGVEAYGTNSISLLGNDFVRNRDSMQKIDDSKTIIVPPGNGYN
ncbi:alginate lyase family protein [Sphingobacterium sp. JB170]|uniref:alginate lyase family protein n=1 Tax=Sphingobacterium sp. JB170 TaxID=1434842 RepID=UPI00097E8A27|nr:alginate lyase family protein [Sphingobacterium sp. JB170]SJN46664.1 putative secreted protein [Sphingobacterium sp. JB170]